MISQDTICPGKSGSIPSDDMEDIIRELTKGMTTAKWKTIPIEEVEIGELHPIQERGRPLAKDHVSTGDVALYCVDLNGTLYIEDGHTRYYQALSQGVLTLPVRRYRVSGV